MKIIYFYSSLSDKKKELLKKIVVRTTLITIGILATQGVVPVFAIANAEGIEPMGYAIWKVIKKIAMFVLAGFTVRDVLKEMNDSSLQDIGATVVKYGAAWVIIVFILKVFTWIDNLAN